MRVLLASHHQGAIPAHWQVFIIKELVPIMVIAYAPLLALWLNPSQAPLLAARCSVHIFAMVLTPTSPHKVHSSPTPCTLFARRAVLTPRVCACVRQVLVVLKATADNGLGKLTYLIWADKFAIVQFGIILTGLIESIVVHVMLRLDRTVRRDPLVWFCIVYICRCLPAAPSTRAWASRQVLGYSFDAVFRVLLPVGIYPFVCMGMIMVATEVSVEQRR